MTLEELKECEGSYVHVLLDGQDALGTVSSRFSQDGRPVLEWPAPANVGVWEDLRVEPLTDQDIAALYLNEDDTISSTIRLSNEGGRHRL